VAHTDHLDFMVMNGGSGAVQTEESIGRVLIGLAGALRQQARPDDGISRLALYDAVLSPHPDPLPAGEGTCGRGDLATRGAA